MTARSLLRIALALLCAAFWIPAASAQQLTIALGSEPTTLDPQVREDGSERAVNDNVYETLLARTPDGNLAPGLAAAMPALVDPTTWEVKLRPGIRFHDGSPLDAAAVAYSIERVIDPKLKSEQASFFSTIAGASKVDDLTVRIRTNGPDPIMAARLYWLKIVSPAHAAGKQIGTAPLGTGPYRFVGWNRGRDITLEANKDYWGEKPRVQKVVYRFVSEPGTRLAGLMAGEFDLITNLLPEFVERVPKAAHVRGLENPIVILNADGGITKDVRVRKALNLAVDKKALAEGLFEGRAIVAPGQLLGPAHFGFNEKLAAYGYDPKQARKLLEEAGVVGKKIQMVGTSGRWLKDREVIEAVAAYWQDVGLKVDVKIYEFGEYLNRLFDRNTRADAIFVVNSNEMMDADRSLSAYYKAGGVGASNTDAELAGLIDSARTEVDTGRRRAMYHQAVQRAWDNAYFVWLLNIEDVYGTSKRLQWTPRMDGKILVKEMSLK
ncbi:MAG: ABC transporter substrate-binding protein [Burkholderiaceae bacterium]|nr:ABC transporter substrate-binding protein [Burkholderiaceae bacterium]